MANPATEARSAAPAGPAKRDFRQEVTDRIVNMLEGTERGTNRRLRLSPPGVTFQRR